MHVIWIMDGHHTVSPEVRRNQGPRIRFGSFLLHNAQCRNTRRAERKGLTRQGPSQGRELRLTLALFAECAARSARVRRRSRSILLSAGSSSSPPSSSACTRRARESGDVCRASVVDVIAAVIEKKSMFLSISFDLIKFYCIRHSTVQYRGTGYCHELFLVYNSLSLPRRTVTA